MELADGKTGFGDGMGFTRGTFSVRLGIDGGGGAFLALKGTDLGTVFGLEGLQQSMIIQESMYDQSESTVQAV